MKFTPVSRTSSGGGSARTRSFVAHEIQKVGPGHKGGQSAGESRLLSHAGSTKRAKLGPKIQAIPTGATNSSGSTPKVKNMTMATAMKGPTSRGPHLRSQGGRSGINATSGSA